jgi:hypothetical protein
MLRPAPSRTPTLGGKAYASRAVTTPMSKTCSVTGCLSPVESHGLCAKHAQRFRRYGDPLHVTPESIRRANNRAAQLARFSDAEVKPTTYRKRHGRHEHRVVAEEMLGRPLMPGEIVHHLDGNRHNNDPANLQVMTQGAHIREHLAPDAGPIEWQGKSLSPREWAAGFGIPVARFYSRRRAGWSMERIASTPIRKWGKANG